MNRASQKLLFLLLTTLFQTGALTNSMRMLDIDSAPRTAMPVPLYLPTLAILC